MDIGQFGSFVFNSLELASVKVKQIDFGFDEDDNEYAKIKTKHHLIKIVIKSDLIVLKSLDLPCDESNFNRDCFFKAFEHFGDLTTELKNYS